MIAIVDWLDYELPMQERYYLIRQVGFDGVMLWWHEIPGRGNYRDAPSLARRAGLLIENIHAPFDGINMLWLDNLDGNAVEGRLLDCVADCAELEIPTMVMHLSGGFDPPPVGALGLDRIKRIAEKAEKSEVNVALENLHKTENLAFALSRVDSPRVGFCYDSGHNHCFTPGEDLLSSYGSRLMALHLHDNDGRDDLHRLPLDGTIDWPATMKAVARTGYLGATALEVHGDYGHLTAEEFLHVAYGRAKRLEAWKQSEA